VSRWRLIGIALAVYLCIMVAGGVAYYVVDHMSSSQQPAASPASTATNTAASVSDAEQQALAQAKQQREAREARIDELEQSMQVETVSGNTYYRFPLARAADLSSGLYLEAFVRRGNQGVQLLGEIVYHYTIDDPAQTAWIYGDHLTLSAKGQSVDIALQPERQQRSMAQDAGALTERSQFTFDADGLAVARAAAVGGGQLVYYKAGGKSRSQAISSEEIQQLGQMIELYELLLSQEEE